MSPIKGLSEKRLNGRGLRILIIHTRWNTEVVARLVEGCKQKLEEMGVTSITTKDVPGAYELPFAAKAMLKKGEFDACIPIGVLIKGSTMHFEYISGAVSQGLMNVGLETGFPVIFGVLTCLTEEQAMIRAGMAISAKLADSEEPHNHGTDWACAAVEMALLNNSKT